MPQGSGSGFLWDKDGHVVTNYHVIRGASDLRYTLISRSYSNQYPSDDTYDNNLFMSNCQSDIRRPISV